MPNDIKTREIIRDIKTLDKKSTMREALRDSSVRTKDAVQSSAEPEASTNNHANPESYATDKTEQFGKGAAAKVADKTKNAARQTHDNYKQVRKAQNNAKQANRAKQSATQAKAHAQSVGQKVAQTNKAAQQTATRAPKQVTRTIKTAGSTAGKTAKASTKAVKTSAKVAKTTARSAQVAAKTSAKAAQATRAATKAAVTAAKAAAKATVALVKAAIAAIKSLVAAIAAGGWVAVAAVVIICMVGLIVASAFGIFFSSESGNGQTMTQVVSEINTEYTEKIDKIKSDNPHDNVMLTGKRASWKEALAVYAVKTTTAESGAMEVVTVDDQRKELIRTIFWDMNSLTSRVEDREITELVMVDDGNGGYTEEYQTTTIRTLYIEQHAKTADDMATQYGFNAEQIALLHELLDAEYDSMWTSILYGIHNGSGDIVEVAISQIGNVGGQPYWSWYGYSGRVEWCACFVSWCANECGYIDSGIILKFSYCPTGVQWFKDAGLWQDKGYVPAPGDIIFFDWGGDGVSDHVGIVESCDGSTIFIIEGNSGDACRRSSYSINGSSVMGFGILRQ